MLLQRKLKVAVQAALVSVISLTCTLACAASTSHPQSAGHVAAASLGEVDQYPSTTPLPPKPPRASPEPDDGSNPEHYPGTGIIPPKPPKAIEPNEEVDQYPGITIPPPKPPKAVEPIEGVDHYPGVTVVPPKPPK